MKARQGRSIERGRVGYHNPRAFPSLVSRHNLDSQELRGRASFQCGVTSFSPALRKKSN